MMSTPSVHHDSHRHLFELEVDGQVAHLEYREKGGVLTILHTIVPGALGGRGYGSALVDAAVSFASGRGLEVASECGFATRHLGARNTGHESGEAGH